MTIRIPGSPSTPQNPQITNDPGVCTVESQTSATATAPATTSKPAPYLDAYGPDDTSKDASFSESKQLSTSTPESKAQEFSVKDAIVEKSSITDIAPKYEKDNTPLETRKNVQILTKLLDDNNGKLPRNLDSALNTSGFFKEADSMFQLVDLVDNKKELHKILSNVEGSNPQVADKLIAAIEDKVRVHIGNIMLANLKPKIEDVRTSIAELNKDSSSRREFLSNLANHTGDPAIIQRELQNVGILETDAKSLAATLAQAHGDPEKLSAIATGDVGERKWGALSGVHSEFASTDKQLGKLLDKLESSAHYLLNNAGNSQLKASRLLINPNVELIRNEVIKDFAALSPPEYAKTIDRIVNEGIASAKKDQQFEKDQSFVIMEALNIGIKAFDAVPLLGNTLSVLASGPGMIVADDDVHLANMARTAGAGTSENVDAALENRQKVFNAVAEDQLMSFAKVPDDIQFGARLSGHLSD